MLIITKHLTTAVLQNIYQICKIHIKLDAQTLMNKKELTGKDLLLCFLYSPGQTNDINEPIVGRTKLTKMMYLFEKEIYPKFFNDTLSITLPQFEPYYFGPFSKELFEDLSFFKAIGLIETSETNIPLSPAHRMESEKADDDNLDDEWSEASFDSEENEEEFESQYYLTTNGKKYVTDKVWDFFSLPQKEKLKQFKAQINRISLDSLLRYVYTKYPDDTVNSVIADNRKL